MNETLLWAWKPTPENEKDRLAFDLLNRMNFLLQYLVKEQSFVNEILNNSTQPSSEIMEAMGNDGEKWMHCYNAVNQCITLMASLNGKELTDISAETIVETTKNIQIDVDGTIKMKSIIIEVEKPILGEEIITG